jgi:hypothetical protein
VVSQGAALRQQRVAGNRAAAEPAEARIQALGVCARGVEDEQGLAARLRFLLGRFHQGRADAVTAGAIRDHHLRDVGAVRLVLRLLEDELDGADDAVAVVGDEENPLAAVDARGDAAPERLGARRVDRQHEADRRAAFDDVDHQRGERLDVGVGNAREAANGEARRRCARHGRQFAAAGRLAAASGDLAIALEQPDQPPSEARPERAASAPAP